MWLACCAVECFLFSIDFSRLVPCLAPSYGVLLGALFGVLFVAVLLCLLLFLALMDVLFLQSLTLQTGIMD